jgi:uncharacterized protein involved in outer membrane biogenesis
MGGDETAGTEPKRSRYRRWGMWFGALAAIYGLYLLAGFFLAPGLIRSQATEWVKTNLGKQLALGEIKFNPFTLALDVSDIAVPGRGGPMVALGHLRVRFALLSLFQDAYRFSELRLDRPFVNAVLRPDGSLNLIELVPPSRPDSGPAPALRFDLLSVDRGRVIFSDQSLPNRPQQALQPINFLLRDFHTKASEGGEFTLDARSPGNEAFSWRGTLSIAPIASKGRFVVSALQIATIAKFLNPVLPVTLTSGQANLNGQYDFAYGPAGARLNLAIPSLAFSELALDGGDALHGAVKVSEAALAISHLGFATGPGNSGLTDVTMPHLALHGASLSGTGPAKGQTIGLGDLVLDGLKLDFPRRTVAIQSLSLAALDLPVTRERDGAFSFARFLPILSAQPAPTPPEAAGNTPWTVKLANVTVADTSVRFQDRATAPTAQFDVTALAVTASGLGTDLQNPVTLKVTARLNSRADIMAQGNVTPASRAADLQIALANVPIKAAIPYAPKFPALDLRSGDLDLSGSLFMSGGDKSRIHFSGEASVDNLGVYEKADKGLLLGWRSLRVTGIDYRPERVEIARARLSRPTGRIAILPDRSFNLAALAATSSEGSGAPAPKSSKPGLDLRLKRLDIDGGSMQFADFSIDPNFQAPIDALQGSITNIGSAPNAVATIDLKGQVIDQFSPVTVTGTANLLGYDRNTNIKVAFRNIELPIFNPYSGHYAGYAIAKGKLSTDFTYRIVNRALNADHHVTIDQLEWGTATDSKDRVTWPIRLATALLKDRNGVIDLDVPVAGSLDDPSFHFGPIIWKILGNILEKIVAAPFDLIGSLFSGADKAQFVEFAPGSPLLPAGAADSLAALAKALDARPALQLDIPAGPGGKEDATGIADERIDALLMAREIKRGRPAAVSALSLDDQNGRLSDLYEDRLKKSPQFPDTLPPAPSDPAKPLDADQQKLANENLWMRAELRKAFQPGNAELATLGSARGTAIRDALLAKGSIDPARVFLTTNEAGEDVKNGVRLELKLR